jgi:hypothetical protein
MIRTYTLQICNSCEALTAVSIPVLAGDARLLHTIARAPVKEPQEENLSFIRTSWVLSCRTLSVFAVRPIARSDASIAARFEATPQNARVIIFGQVRAASVH